MSTTAIVPIDEVEIDAGVGVLVHPRIPPIEHYEQIYRSASGVRWNRERRALVAYEPKGMPAPWWFDQIIAAVQSEYGQRLELRADTRWTNVAPEVRREMESKHAVRRNR
jgi:hypothetical protein